MNENHIERLRIEFIIVEDELNKYCKGAPDFAKIVKINEMCNNLLSQYGRFNRLTLDPIGLVTPEDYVMFANRIKQLEMNKKLALDDMLDVHELSIKISEHYTIALKQYMHCDEKYFNLVAAAAYDRVNRGDQGLEDEVERLSIFVKEVLEVE